jgi:predicted NBD/HSP70 family sugar kinase
MNIDKTLKRIAETVEDPAFDVEAGRKRLRQAVRRLHDDSLEGQRIDYIADRLERYEKAYRLGHAALQRQDYGTAERYLRRAAEHGNDEAAYWLALLLERRSNHQRLKGHVKKAGSLAAEAREWRLRAQESGIAEALDSAPAGDTWQDAKAARPKKPREQRGQRADRIRENVTASPAQEMSSPSDLKTSSRREYELAYAIGIELQPYRFTAVLTDGSGEIIGDKEGSLADMESGPVIRAMAAVARELMMSTLGQELHSDQVALGVELGGPVDTETGTVHYLCKYPPRSSDAAPFKWQNISLGSQLQQETGFRTVILNDAAAFAEWEQWHGVGRMTGDFVLMLIREGVGGAVVSNGQHFKGPVEIGQFVTYPDSPRHSLWQGDTELFGVLESAAGGTAIAAGAGKVTRRAVPDLQTAIGVANEDGPGRKAAVAFKSAGVAAAAGLSYLVQFAGPSHVVLYAPEGMIKTGTQVADVFLDQVRNFRTAVAFEKYRECELVLRDIGTHHGAHGVALAALRRCFQAEPAESLVDAGAVR